MNPIGLPVIGQQAILTNCNDLYVIEARAIGTEDWYPFSLVPAPADEAAAAVKQLNSGDSSTVYRAVLVRCPDSPASSSSADAAVFPAEGNFQQHDRAHLMAAFSKVICGLRELREPLLTVELIQIMKQVAKESAHADDLAEVDRLLAVRPVVYLRRLHELTVVALHKTSKDTFSMLNFNRTSGRA